MGKMRLEYYNTNPNLNGDCSFIHLLHEILHVETSESTIKFKLLI